MWISKKEWSALFDENFALKNRIEELEHIERATKNVEETGKAKINCISTKYLLVGVHHYGNLVQDLNIATKNHKEAQKEIEHYKQLYLNELQKRLELADMVRKMDGD